MNISKIPFDSRINNNKLERHNSPYVKEKNNFTGNETNNISPPQKNNILKWLGGSVVAIAGIIATVKLAPSLLRKKITQQISNGISENLTDGVTKITADLKEVVAKALEKSKLKPELYEYIDASKVKSIFENYKTTFEELPKYLQENQKLKTAISANHEEANGKISLLANHILNEHCKLALKEPYGNYLVEINQKKWAKEYPSVTGAGLNGLILYGPDIKNSFIGDLGRLKHNLTELTSKSKPGFSLKRHNINRLFESKCPNESDLSSRYDLLLGVIDEAHKEFNPKNQNSYRSLIKITNIEKIFPDRQTITDRIALQKLQQIEEKLKDGYKKGTILIASSDNISKVDSKILKLFDYHIPGVDEHTTGRKP